MMLRLLACLILAMQLAFLPASGPSYAAETQQAAKSYDYTVLPLERNGYKLHLDCLRSVDTTYKKNILLVHGLTYSSHEFDVNYGDYSLARFLADKGYAVWRTLPVTASPRPLRTDSCPTRTTPPKTLPPLPPPF